jgi:hypothetical protein
MARYEDFGRQSAGTGVPRRAKSIRLNMEKIKTTLYPTHAILMILAILINGCSTPTPTPSIEQMDKSPFTGDPCAAPCWHNLTIGESNKHDVISELSTLTFIEQDSIYIHELSLPSLDPSIYAQGTEITANCRNNAKQCIRLTVVEDFLTEIVSTLNYEIDFNKAIEYLGNPDYVGYQDLGAEEIICEIDLIWRDKQLILASEKFHGNDAISKCGLVRDTQKPLSSIRIFEVRYISDHAMNLILFSELGEFFEFSGIIPET